MSDLAQFTWAKLTLEISEELLTNCRKECNSEHAEPHQEYTPEQVQKAIELFAAAHVERFIENLEEEFLGQPRTELYDLLGPPQDKPASDPDRYEPD